MHLIGKRARFLWSENGPKLEIRELSPQLPKKEWLVIPRVLEINCRLKLEWVKNMVLRRFLTCRSRLTGAKLS